MELVTKVRDAEHWAQVLESSEKKLVGTAVLFVKAGEFGY